MDLSKSSGRIFGVSVHLGAHFSCYFHILFTPWTLQNSHAEAFCLWKDDCLWKNQKRKKVLDKKEKKRKTDPRKGVPLCQEKKNSFVEVTSTGRAPHWCPDFKQRSCC